jgi:4'-phosphopantetheinyl transferase
MKEKASGQEAFSPRALPLTGLEGPVGDTVHLWHLDLDRLSNPLHPDASAGLGSLPAIQQTAVRRFYLRLLLGAYLGVPGKDVHISRRIKGKPELNMLSGSTPLDFNMARSRCCYLIGVSNGPAIGVDLEVAARHAHRPLALARRYFSEAETKALAAYEGEQLHRSFIHAWACKEAVVKASGLGIADQLHRFTVDVDPDRPPRILHMEGDDPDAWSLALAEPVPGAIAAVAVRQESVSLVGFTL